MSAAAGPGPVPVEMEGLPEGWEAFATNDSRRYFSFAQVYYYCRALNLVQWQRPGIEDAHEIHEEETIIGKPPYRRGDEFIPNPPPVKPYGGMLSDENYRASNAVASDVFQPDEDMLEACLEGNLEKLRTALSDGADVSLQNQPWLNGPLHLANCPFTWDADLVHKEKARRFEMCQYLLRQGAETEIENLFHCKPIDLAIFHGYDDTVRLLMSKNSQPSIFGAAYLGDLNRVKELLAQGVDIDLKGRYGRTAFSEAHLRGQWHVETYLAQQGCSRSFPHPENMKFNPGGASLPRAPNLSGPRREKQYYREDDPLWYDDMMEKRFPGYLATLAKKPRS